MSLALDGTSPRSRTSDPVTSVEAGRSVNLMHSQGEVLAVFAVEGRPLADHQLVTAAELLGSKYTPQRLRSARAELVELGFIREVEGVFRPGATRKRRAHVWALTT